MGCLLGRWALVPISAASQNKGDGDNASYSIYVFCLRGFC